MKSKILLKMIKNFVDESTLEAAVAVFGSTIAPKFRTVSLS